MVDLIHLHFSVIGLQTYSKGTPSKLVFCFFLIWCNHLLRANVMLFQLTSVVLNQGITTCLVCFRMYWFDECKAGKSRDIDDGYMISWTKLPCATGQGRSGRGKGKKDGFTCPWSSHTWFLWLVSAKVAAAQPSFTG